MNGFAYFGPNEKYDTARGGFCIAAFAIIRRQGAVLFVKASDSTKWMNEWTPNWRSYDSGRLEQEMNKFRLPGSFVRQGEPPDSALRRVMEDQLGISEYDTEASTLRNFYVPSTHFEGERHWDYLFVYEVKPKTDLPSQSPWLSFLGYVDSASIGSLELGNPHGDLQSQILGRSIKPQPGSR